MLGFQAIPALRLVLIAPNTAPFTGEAATASLGGTPALPDLGICQGRPSGGGDGRARMSSRWRRGRRWAKIGGHGGHHCRADDVQKKFEGIAR